MNIEEMYKTLTKDIPTLEIYLNEPMSNHTSFKIGGIADIYVKAKTIQEIQYIIEKAKNENIPLTIIGNGSNLLVRDKGIRGITIQIDIQKIEIQENDLDIIVRVGAGTKMSVLARKLQQEGIAGFEFAAGIPGSIGGAIRMNAGAYGTEFSNITKEVTYIDENGKIQNLKSEKLDFSYRHSKFTDNKGTIIEATLKLEKGDPEEIGRKIDELLAQRKQKQPTELPSAGSTFKRGKDFYASRIIEDAGLKGYKIGGAGVSEKHAGFVVNNGNATAKDVLNLIEYVKNTVYEKFGKELEPEIEIIGEE